MKPLDIWDPIHSFIRVNALEVAVLDSEPLQRLRNIRQLASAHYVFPGAEHSRFGHSLGVMHVATQMYDSLKQKGCLKQLGVPKNELDRYLQLLRLAALVHDVGHPPFSHAGESGGLLPKEAEEGHEWYTRRIVEERIDPIISNHAANAWGITGQDISALLHGTELSPLPIVLRQMIAGELDADRIDYLMRDSYYTGVPYGRLDYHQLISTLTIIAIDPKTTVDDVPGKFALGVEEPGLHAAEGLLIGRYFMFSNVYFHKTRRVFDYHLSNVTRRVLEDTDGTSHYPTDISDYLKWDDSRIIAWMGRHSEDEDVNAICRRKHFRLVTETREHAQVDKLQEFQDKFEQLPTELREVCWVDKAEEVMNKFEKVDFRVRPRDDRKSPQRIEELSSLIESLSPITRRRLYCVRDKHKEVADAWDKKGG